VPTVSSRDDGACRCLTGIESVAPAIAVKSDGVARIEPLCGCSRQNGAPGDNGAGAFESTSE